MKPQTVRTSSLMAGAMLCYAALACSGGWTIGGSQDVAGAGGAADVNGDEYPGGAADNRTQPHRRFALQDTDLVEHRTTKLDGVAYNSFADRKPIVAEPLPAPLPAPSPFESSAR